MRKSTRFRIGSVIIVLAYGIPLAITILLDEIWMLILILMGFFGSIYLLYRVTYKVKPRYPVVPPTGQPDIYTALRIPRPIYEDMEQYPWLFKKTKRKWTERWKKVERKN